MFKIEFENTSNLECMYLEGFVECLDMVVVGVIVGERREQF
jgi:hypothetical protein